MVNSATRSSATLSALPARFAELRSLAQRQAGASGRTGAALDGARREADSIAAQIDSFSIGPAPKFRTTGFRVEAPDSNVVASVRGHNKYDGPWEFDVSVNVTASAQAAGFLLSFGGASLNLGGSGQNDGASDQFVIRIGGPLDEQELSFASGTSLDDLVSQINSFADVLGAHASRAGDGSIRIDSDDVGSDQFVSVEVVDDGGINGSGGIYVLDPRDANAIDPVVAPIAFYNARNKVTDHGQDVAGTINGKATTGHKNTLSVTTAQYNLAIELTQAAAQTGGARYAFHFNTAGTRRPSHDGSPPVPGALLPDTYA